MAKHCAQPECRHTSARQWWERPAGYFKLQELPRVLARPALFDLRALPCAGINHRDAATRNACHAVRRVSWWERKPRTVAAELSFQAKRLAGQPAFAND